MQLINAFLDKKKEVGLRKALKTSLMFVYGMVKENVSSLPYYISGMTDYYLNPGTLKQRDVKRSVDNEKIKEEFIESGFQVVDYDIDRDDFNQWLHNIKFPDAYSKAYGDTFTEKALEHYLSSKLLDLDTNDVFVDVAAASSPWYDLVEKMYRCNTFAVDLHFPADRHDSRLIECDATSMPFDDGSISKIALHCAYEMFENDADTNFIREAGRVLKSGGKIIILPLYMSDFYYILSSPKANRKGINYGKAKRVWRDDKYKIRFSRHYSVGAFKERVVDYSDKLALKIYHFVNEEQMKQNRGDQVYVKFGACFTKE